LLALPSRQAVPQQVWALPRALLLLQCCAGHPTMRGVCAQQENTDS
jgi:hypothetical protein